MAKARKLVVLARADLDKINSLNEKDGNTEDAQTKRARLDLERKEKLLNSYDTKYVKQQKELYSKKMMGTLNEKYDKMKMREQKKAELENDLELVDMPELDSDDDE